MKTVQLSEQDSATVFGILMTHAEMQDARSVETLGVIGRLQRDEPEVAGDLIETLKDGVEDIDDDCDALRRIAKAFEVN